LDVRFWGGGFFYRIGIAGRGEEMKQGAKRVEGGWEEDLVLEEEELVKIVEGRDRENERP
jgi:hypothetical protein